jgi:hypothetical protein
MGGVTSDLDHGVLGLWGSELFDVCWRHNVLDCGPVLVSCHTLSLGWSRRNDVNIAPESGPGEQVIW